MTVNNQIADGKITKKNLGWNPSGINIINIGKWTGI